MQHKISVIIPVYNVEEYLEACITSIINQTYRMLEIILIDDGSTDSSGILCDEFMKRDERILVCHKSNEGLAAARNTGIELSSGELLAFVDSDDMISEHMLNRLYVEMQEQDADLALCDYCRLHELKDSVPPVTGVSNVQVLTGDKLSEMLTSEEYCITLPVAWNKLYRKELFKQLRYPEGRYHEDEFIIHKLLSRVKRAVYIQEKLYGYRIRNNSIVRTDNLVTKNDKLDALQERALYYRLKHKEPESLNTLICCIRECIWKCMEIGSGPKQKDFVLKQAQRVKLILKDNRQIGRWARIKYYLFTIFPRQYITIKNLLNR